MAENNSGPPKLGTFSGDPRAFSSGGDTAVPNPIHHPKDTGVHGVAAGDARSGWLRGEPRDELLNQEENDLRKAITASLRDQEAGSVAPQAAEPRGQGQQTGDPRAAWLPHDVAHGGPHNWQKKDNTPLGNPEIKDPRAPQT